jgi:hypothetical protein
MSRGGVPDFFIVGHPKSGTTALYEMLRTHPEVFMPAIKEPWYFSTDLRDHAPPRPQGIPATLSEYLALFSDAGPGQRIGEASPHYLWSRTAAAEIAKVQPEARIIAILREPASFLNSLHLQFLEVFYETTPDLRQALALEDDRRAGRRLPRYGYWPQLLMYSEHVRYVEQLRRYLDVFGRENLMVLIYDDFRADNEGTLRAVQRFIGVDDSVPLRVLDANPTVRVRSQRLNEATQALGVGRGPLSRSFKAAVKRVSPDRLRRRTFYALREKLVFTDPNPPDPQLMRELRVRYRGEVEALSEYLDRDLVKEWGYDQLD